MDSLAHSFVRALPSTLDHGVLYISGDHNIVAHLCCCGCGSEVITPLGPAGWTLRYDGSVSVSPSIGNGTLPCRSHYIIDRGAIRWLSAMKEGQHRAAKDRDTQAARVLNRESVWVRVRRGVGQLIRRLRE
jgi:hypothetical protein